MPTLAELRARPELLRTLAGLDLLAAAPDERVLKRGDGRGPALIGRLEASTMLTPVQRKPESFLDQVTIGRASTCDLVLDDPSVSNVHAHFELGADGRATGLVDLGSSNGTHVEGRAIVPHVLVPLGRGDCIRLGQSVFYFLDHAGVALLLG
jgi:pSer/pThr/pTyr-binding forkhead associated (FHA) protein